MSDTLCACGKEKAFDEDKCPACQKIKTAVIVKKPKSKKVVTQESKQVVPQQEMQISQLISEAVKNGSDLAQLRELLSLKKDFEADKARKAYCVSMVDTQSKIEVVVKTKSNSQTNSKYADLTAIIVSIKPVYTGEGFSLTFYEGEARKTEDVRIMCDVTHSLGHKETFHYDLPIDDKGIKGSVNKTQIHAKGSTTSYGRRYLTCMIFNVPTGDDNDAQKTTELVSEKELHTIRDYLLACHADEGKFCEYLKVQKLEDLPKSDYKKAISALLAKMGGK